MTGEHPKELVGTWKLLIRSSCTEYGVVSDTITLRADGTFDQHVVLNGGKQVDNANQHWEYLQGGRSGDIALRNRLEFFTPEHFHTSIGQGASTLEVLIVDADPEPVIVLHPDSDCVYVKNN